MGGNDRELVERLLDSARRDVAPDEAQRQAKIVERVLGGAAGGGGDGPLSGARSGRSWLGKTAAGLGAIALVGAGVFAVARGPTTQAQRGAVGASAEPARVETPAPSDAPTERASGGAQLGAAGTSVWELPSVATAQKPALSGPPPAAVAPAATDELALELAALEGARRRLRDQDPAGAMKLLDDFDRRFPRPRAGEEATVLKVEVLLGLGRAADAHRIGRDFITRRPDSIYRARVVQLLGDAAP